MRIRRRRGLLPPVIKTLLIANAAVFALHYLIFLFGVDPLSDLYRQLPLYIGYGDSFQAWQFLTYMFLHADLMHIGMNMFMLWMFGCEVEEEWGAKRFAFFYLFCGLGGALLHIAATYVAGGPPSALIGASAAVAGVTLAFGLAFPDRIIFFILPIPARAFVFLYAVLELLRGISVAGGMRFSNVAHFAHLGGIVFGLLFILIERARRKRLR